MGYFWIKAVELADIISSALNKEVFAYGLFGGHGSIGGQTLWVH